jgi:hypothetical protein
MLPTPPRPPQEFKARVGTPPYFWKNKVRFISYSYNKRINLHFLVSEVNKATSIYKVSTGELILLFSTVFLISLASKF